MRRANTIGVLIATIVLTLMLAACTRGRHRAHVVPSVGVLVVSVSHSAAQPPRGGSISTPGWLVDFD